MILLRLSAVINDVTIEVEGEANDREEILMAWESFIYSTSQADNNELISGAHE